MDFDKLFKLSRENNTDSEKNGIDEEAKTEITGETLIFDDSELFFDHEESFREEETFEEEELASGEEEAFEEVELSEETEDFEEVELSEETEDFEKVELSEETEDFEEVELPEEAEGFEEVELLEEEETFEEEQLKEAEFFEEEEDQEETKLFGEEKNDALRKELNLIHSDLTELYRRLDDAVSYTTKKDSALNAMREELNAYRDNLLMKINQSILYDVIDLREGVKSQAAYERANGNLQMSLDEVEYIADDLGIILEKNDVEIYKTRFGEKFMPGKHRIVKKIPCGDKELVHTICESQSYGYMYNGKVIYPEKVTVYIAEQMEES